MKDITHSILIGGALAAALAASGGAQAQGRAPWDGGEVIARKDNGAGGEILLTTMQCTEGRVIFSSDLRGCAKVLLPDRLYVTWDGGGTSILSTDGWIPISGSAPGDLLPKLPKPPHAQPAVIRRTP